MCHLDIGINALLNPCLDHGGDLVGLHAGVLFVGDGLEVVELAGDGLASLLVEHLVGVDDAEGQDIGLGLDGGLEAAAVELAHDVAVLGAGALGEDQDISSVFELLGAALDDEKLFC